jgi:catechol 2,3-dioxygenase-like lactoylglutathione lyase family enzyme
MTGVAISQRHSEHGVMKLSLTALLVHDYDEAIDWYCSVLGFHLVTDDEQVGG